MLQNDLAISVSMTNWESNLAVAADKIKLYPKRLLYLHSKQQDKRFLFTHALSKRNLFGLSEVIKAGKTIRFVYNYKFLSIISSMRRRT